MDAVLSQAAVPYLWQARLVLLPRYRRGVLVHARQ
jgi:hypothetical protein